ncbi:unnamed protein product [Closterium sp. NIES-54]
MLASSTSWSSALCLFPHYTPPPPLLSSLSPSPSPSPSQVWPYHKVRPAQHRFRLLSAATIRFFNLSCPLPTYHSHSLPLLLLPPPSQVWPYLKLRPALHRFRLLSAANARFFNLSLVCADRRDYPNFYPPLKGSRVKFAQISSDAGYLVRPSYIRTLLLAPGERKDILVDFSSLPSFCRDVIVTNSAPSPFPNGTPPDSHTGVVMRIAITQTKKIASPKIPEKIANPLPPINLGQAAQHRWKMLVTVKDAQADAPLRVLIDNAGFKDAATEAPRVVRVLGEGKEASL